MCNKALTASHSDKPRMETGHVMTPLTPDTKRKTRKRNTSQAFSDAHDTDASTSSSASEEEEDAYAFDFAPTRAKRGRLLRESMELRGELTELKDSVITMEMQVSVAADKMRELRGLLELYAKTRRSCAVATEGPIPSPA